MFFFPLVHHMLLFVFQGKFQKPPVVLVTAEHFRVGLKHDAAHIWTQNIQVGRFDICMRELQNFDGVHEKIAVVSFFLEYQ